MLKRLVVASIALCAALGAPTAFAANYDHTELRVDSSTVPSTVSVGDTGQILPDQSSPYRSMRYAFTYKIANPQLISIADDGTWEALSLGTTDIEIIPVNIDTATPAFREEMKRLGFEFSAYMPDVHVSQKFTVVVADSSPVFRLYNSCSLEHLYTADANERDVLSGLPDWAYEGVAWNSTVHQGTGVYRLYNHSIGKHLYTSDSHEISVLAQRGWVNEGIAYYSSGSVPIFRLYLDSVKIHLLTSDKNEVDTLAQGAWRYEGIALFGR